MAEIIKTYFQYAIIFITNITRAIADSLGSDSQISQSGRQLLAQIENSEAINIIQTISLVASLLLAIVVTIILFKFLQFQKNKITLAESLIPPKPTPSSAFNNRWEEIRHHVDSIREAEWKMAVIEADKLVEDVLKRGGFPGETMGEKLMAINSGQLASLQGLWDAHKTRNRIAHDLNYFLRHAEARRAVNLYEQSLRELGAIE